VRIQVRVDEGTNVRAIGCDIQTNELILKKKQIIRSAEIGLLATVGVTKVKCYSKPIIGILSTGNELVDIDMTPNPGTSQIRDSNRISLSTAFRADGYHCIDLGIVRDVKADLQSKLLHAATQCDVVVTSGGVSMGDADFVKPLLESLGTVHFGRLNMKPGKPTTFASIIQNSKKTLFFGLPGNPVSCLVTKALMIDPALRRMQGLDSAACMHIQVPVKISSNLKLDHERPEYHRAIVSLDQSGAGLVAVSTGNQASSRLMSLCSSNALLCLPQQQGILPAGSVVQALLTGPITTPSPLTCYHKAAASLDYPADHKSVKVVTKVPMRVGILTISDRASQGVYHDESGPEIAKILAAMSSSDWQIDATVATTKIVPDDVAMIQSTLVEWADSNQLDVILTNGGTGFGIRDLTPEAVKGVLHREAPALAQALINEGLKHTPLAVLSRPVAGTRNSTLICTLPGSVKAIRENMVALRPLLPRIVELLINQECGVLANTPGYSR
jgi:gephyrin